MADSTGDMNSAQNQADAAQASVRAQRRLLDEMDDANRSAWAWFPPIFVVAFSLLSFAGTYIGLRDIIATGDARGGFVGDALVFFLVLLATGAMVFFLRRAVINFFSLGGVAAFGAYLLLLLFSITFGFAFYWGRLEASGQAISGAQTRMERFSDDIQTSAFALRSTATALSGLSGEFKRLAEEERLNGGTCGDGSRPGPGPRMRHRERRAAEIEARVAEITPRFAVVQGPVAALEAELKKIQALGKPGAVASGDPGAAREAQFQETRRAARQAAVEINALAADASLAALAAEFKSWGREYQDPTLVRRDDPQGQPYQCIQVAAGRQLLNAGERLANLPKVAAPDLPDYAGAEATREAVFRMLDSVSGAAAGGSSLSALFSEDGSALTPQGEAALRSSVGASVRAAQAAPAAAAATVEAKGLRPSDRFPLGVAFLIDMLLFAFVLIERPGRKYFDRMKRRVREAVEEEFNPLRMVALRRALDDDPDWRLLRLYRFDMGDRSFIALPADASEDFDLEDPDRLTIEALRDVVKLWRRNGILRPALFKPEALQDILIDAGRKDLTLKWRVIDCYEFNPTGFERLLLSGMTEGEREAVRDARAQRRNWLRRRIGAEGRADPHRDGHAGEPYSDQGGWEDDDEGSFEPEDAAELEEVRQDARQAGRQDARQEVRREEARRGPSAERGWRWPRPRLARSRATEREASAREAASPIGERLELGEDDLAREPQEDRGGWNRSFRRPAREE